MSRRDGSRRARSGPRERAALPSLARARWLSRILRERRLGRGIQRAEVVEPASDGEAITYGKDVNRVGVLSLIWHFLSIFR